jgi:hypothetical protein
MFPQRTKAGFFAAGLLFWSNRPEAISNRRLADRLAEMPQREHLHKSFIGTGPVTLVYLVIFLFVRDNHTKDSYIK